VYLLKKIFMLLMVAMLVFVVPFPYAQANDANKMHWSTPKQGTYKPLHANTLNWSGDVLDKGGFSLADLEVTTDSRKADFVINQYGAIGAASLLKLSGEQLEDPTSRNRSGFLNSYTMAAGDLYLVKLHDGKYAKIRIDRVLGDQVTFSYVTETEAKIVPNNETTNEPKAPEKQPAANAPASEKPASQQPANKKSTIQLTVDNPRATVQGKSLSLDVAPTVVNGNTLVPLRFLAESLGAEVKWNGDERKITLTQKGQTIELWIDRTSALVNGRTVTLEAAPQIISDTTVVPLRFISETFKQEVQYEASTRKITITGNIDAEASPSTPPTKNTAATGQGFVVTLMGNWDVLYISNPWTLDDTGPTGSLSIYPEGTYELKMKHVGEFVGVWYIAKEDEVEGHPEAIVLKNAMEKTDWAVVLGEDGMIELQKRYAWSNNALYNPTISVMWMGLYHGEKASDDPKHINNFKTKDHNFDSFVNSYDLWIEGGATNLYYRDTGNYATHEYNAGGDAGTLTVHADGTYTMKTKETKSGKWRPSKINEVFGYEFSIILEDGPDDIDWALLVNNNGKTMVAYDSGKWADGSTSWLPYYIASPK
jgi:hypothetical protein